MTGQNSQALQALKDLLASIERDKELSQSDIDEIEPLLYEAWDELDGSSDGGMNSDKLLGRMEKVVWSPPSLQFVVERHGALKLGSTRAELQYWCVNIESGNAQWVGDSTRQVVPREKPWDAKTPAKEVAGLIRRGEDANYLKWNEPRTRVQVILNRIVPYGFRQTTTARNERFRSELLFALADDPWVQDIEVGTRFVLMRNDG